jgi:hypothetical protein
MTSTARPLLVLAGSMVSLRPKPAAWPAEVRFVIMSKDQLFVERREQGDYAIRRGNSNRASAVLPTQAEAIERARDESGTCAACRAYAQHLGGASRQVEEALIRQLR